MAKDTDFGAWLRVERERLQLTQGELARRLGIDAAVIYRIEHGRAQAKADLQRRIEQELKDFADPPKASAGKPRLAVIKGGKKH